MGIAPPIQIATLSMPDTLLLMALALVVFGPRRLPQIGRQIGKLMYEFRKASNDFKFQMEEELRQSEEADRRKKQEEERQRAQAAAPASTEPVTPAPEPAYPSSGESAASPYPGEATFPGPSVQSSPPEPSTEEVTAAAVEAARLRIQPPSTGEIVAAGKPVAPPAGTLPASGSSDNGDLSGANPAAPNEAEKPEQAAHHG